MKILTYGSRGSLVELLQTALGRAAGGGPAVDGVLGGETWAALTSFQAERGIPRGDALASTWRALEPYTACYRAHTLRAGETLMGIAERYGAGVDAIEAANPGIDLLNLGAGGRVIVPLDFESVPAISWSEYANAQAVRALTARYPFLTAFVYGRSAAGHRLRCLRFGTGERTAVFAAAHHANEWITAPALLRCVQELCAAYASGEAAAREIYERTALYFAPLVNPDGVDLVTGAIQPGEGLRRAEEIAADYPQVPWPGGWKANILGTDLNLQYPAGWEAAKEIKFAQGWTSPAPRDYVGAAPLCAAESRALYELTVSARPAVTAAFHTQGEVIYWQYHGYAPAGSDALAESLAAASGYALDSAPDESGNAGYKDWCIDALGIPAFTVECGLGENPLPIGQLDGVCEAVSAIVSAAAEWAVSA